MYRHIMCGLLLATTLGISHIQAQEKTPDLTLQTLFKKVEATNPGLKSKNTAIKTNNRIPNSLNLMFISSPLFQLYGTSIFARFWI